MPAPVKALVVSPDGAARVITTEQTLDALQALIGGGWIEAFSPFDGDWHGYCDEDGKVKGLPANRAATGLAHALGWQGAPWDILCGTIVFLSRDKQGRDADVPERVIAVAREFCEFPLTS